jgi:DNA-binding response OmpR family regulator
VLVVDDDTYAIELVAAVLEKEFEVDSAVDAETALERFEAVRPDLLILDLRLAHDFDGMDVFHEIRRRLGSAPPAILLSSADEAEQTARALGIPVFRKPITRGLLAAVRSAVQSDEKPSGGEPIAPGARVSAEVDGVARAGTVLAVRGGLVQFRDDAGELLFAARERVTRSR